MLALLLIQSDEPLALSYNQQFVTTMLVASSKHKLQRGIAQLPRV